MYRFATLDPRNIPTAQEANEKVFSADCGICLHSSGQLDGETCRYCGGTGKVGIPVLGIEVTVPALASRCSLGNIDPQHSGGNANRAAIEDACEAELPPDGATLVTVRADLDSVGAMALLSLRRQFDTGSAAPDDVDMNRIRLIAEADRFARGGYPGPRPLPSTDNPWPEETATAESSRPLAAIAAAVMDFKVPLVERVAMMERWLVTGEESAEYRSRVEAERLDMIRALETGAIKVETQRIPYGNCPGTAEDFSGVLRCNVCMTEQPEDIEVDKPCGVWFHSIAVVTSTHRAATSVGYAVAPVIVALNPVFRFQGGDPHPKFTVCQFTTGYCDLKSAVVELAAREPGWGGSPTIIGSPQGQGSTLSIEEVTGVVASHILNK